MKLGELNEQQYVESELQYLKSMGATHHETSVDALIPFITLLIREAYRNGYENASKTNLVYKCKKCEDCGKLQGDLENKVMLDLMLKKIIEKDLY